MTAGWFVGILSAFLLVGLLGRHKVRGGEDSTTALMVASRRLPLGVAWISLAATWIGGGYINGTAEVVYDAQQGLVWCQAPWCYALSLIVGGFLFAGPMRNRGYRTMLDLFEERYGPRMAGALYGPALVGDLFWTSAILAALGGTLGTLFDMDPSLVVLLSAAVVVLYTVWGGLWSVAFSDVVQFGCIVGGLLLALPFILERCGGFGQLLDDYRQVAGTQARIVPTSEAWFAPDPWGWQWADSALLLIFGGIPWQVYFQRVLACRSARAATWMSVSAGVACLVVALMPITIGMAGATLDWQQLGVSAPEDASLILPVVLKYAVPSIISLVGLTAIAAAVLSSVDSSILSSASMFAWNVYRPWARREPEDPRLQTVLRLAVVAIGSAAAILALQVTSVYQLWFLCADLVYVVLFPQLVTALFYRRSTATAAAWGAGVALLLRTLMLLAGWEWFPAALSESIETVELLPWRTLIVLVSFAVILGVSQLTSDTSVPKSRQD